MKPLKDLMDLKEQHSHLLRFPFYVPSSNDHIFYLFSWYSLEDNQIDQSLWDGPIKIVGFSGNKITK